MVSLHPAAKLLLSLRDVVDGKYVGYFVENLELKLSPKWETASVSCRHAPKLEEVKIEETTLQQVEKSGTIQFSASKTPGATIGGGVKKTKGSQEKVMKNQCKERWLVCEDGMKDGSYKWDMFYWQTIENARNDPKSARKGAISDLPYLPENSMLTNVPATVDWILQVPPPGDKNHQPLQWDVTCTARAVFLTQKEEKRRLLPNVFKIEPKIVQVELGTKVIKVELNRPLYYQVQEFLSLVILMLQIQVPKWLIYFIPFLLLAMIMSKFV